MLVLGACTSGPQSIPDRYSETCPPEPLPDSEEWWELGEEGEPDPVPPDWFAHVTPKTVEDNFGYTSDFTIGRVQAWWTKPDFLTEVGYPDAVTIPDDPLIFPTGSRPKTQSEGTSDMYVDVRADQVLDILWEAALSDRLIRINLCEDLTMYLLVKTSERDYQDVPPEERIVYSNLKAAGATYDGSGERIGAFSAQAGMKHIWGSDSARHLQVFMNVGLEDLIISFLARTTTHSTGAVSFSGVDTKGV